MQRRTSGSRPPRMQRNAFLQSSVALVPTNYRREQRMLKKFLIASAAGLLLTACQQQPQAVSGPPAAPLPQAYTVYFNTDQSALSSEASATVAQAAAAFKQGGTAVGVRGHT